MAVKFGVAMGCHVTVLSRGTGKKEEALTKLGAHDFVDVTDAEAVKAHGMTFNHILDTIAAPHDLGMYFKMLDYDGLIIMVGLCPEPLKVGAFDYIAQRKGLVGSYIGGIKET